MSVSRGRVVGGFCVSLKGESSWRIMCQSQGGEQLEDYVSVSRGNVVGFFCVSQGGV